MTRRNSSYEMIPALFALILIPQLLFHWLVPVTAVARNVVYGIGTVLTVAAPVTAFAVYHLYGLRRSMCVAIIAVILETVSIVVCSVLLMMDAAVRSAVFALSIVALIYLAGLTPMVWSAARTTAHEAVSGGDQHNGPSGTSPRAVAPTVAERQVASRRTGCPALPPRNR